MDTKQVVERYFSTVNAGDWDGWLELFADNAVVIEPIGTSTGIGALRDGVAALQKGYRSFHNHLEGMIIEGNRGVALTHINGVTRSGVAVELDVANVYLIENGKIVRQRNYLDPVPLQPFLDELKKS